GQGLASAELVNTETSAVFYASDLAGKMAPNGQAEVSVQILPITMGDLGNLDDVIGGVTSTLNETVGEVLSVVDELQSSLIPNEFLTIEGIEELQGAVDALNNLDEATADVLEYNDQVETVVHEDGTVTVDFSDGIGNHIDSAVNDIVIEALN